MPDVILETEYVEINGVPLATPAWMVMDLSPLWDVPGVRGSDRRIPYAEGEQPLRRIYDAKRVVLPLLIFGEANRANVPYADHRVGLLTNFDELVAEVADPDAAPDPGTKLLRLFMPGGVIRSGQCHVIPPLGIGRLGAVGLRAALDLVIPAGRLT